MATSNNTSLYSSTSSNAVVNSRNYTTLYSASTGTVSAQTPYGNANVAGFLAEGSDTGGNSIGNITAAGIISAQGNIVTDANFIGTFIGNISGNIVAAGANTQVQYNNGGVLGASSAFTFNSASNVLSIGGNVTANYLIGNGSQITGLVSTYGNANVAAFLPTYTGNLSGGNLALTGNAAITGGLTTSQNIVSGANIQAAGNIRTTGVSGNITGVNYASANFFVGNGSLLTGIVATSSYANSNVAAFLADFGGNILSTTGNVSAGYFLGNGSQLTGITTTYSNANVATFMAAFGSNTISTSGNVTAGYFAGNGSLLTNLTGANVSGTVATANTAGTVTTNAQPNITSVGILTSLSSTGNITGANINAILTVSALGSIVGGNVFATGSGQVYAGGNVVGGNVITTGLVSATGNVTGNFFIGNGSQLTGLPATYSNANVATFMAAFGSNSISTSGNVTAGYFVGNGSLLTNLTGANVSGTVANATYATSAGTATTANTVTDAAQANITSVGVLTSLSVSGNIVTGNISSTGNVNISGNLNSDDITSTNVTVYGDQVITGNLTVQGTTTTINSNVVTTNDKNITVANNQSTSANLDGAGLDAGNSAGAPVVTWRYNAATTSWQSNVGITPVANLTYDLGTNSLRWNNVYNANVLSSGTVSATGNITGNYFLGNGSQLTGLPDTYGNANVATFMAAFGSNTITTTGNVVVGNLTAGTGNVSATNHVVNGLTANGSAWLGNHGGNTARMALNYVNGNNNHALQMRSDQASLFVDNLGTGANEAYAEIFMNIANVNAPYVNIDVAPGSTGVEYDWKFDHLGNLTLPTNSSAINYANGTSILAGLGTYGNSNVATFMAAFGSNTITTTGNVVAGNLSTTGGITSTGNIVGQLSTAGNVTAGNITVNGLINTSGSLSLTGNISTPSGSIVAGNVTLSPGGIYSTTGNVQAGNLLTGGQISATGNITGNYFLGNGSQLTGLPATYGNANVATFMAAFGSNTITTTGNIVVGNVSGGNGNINGQFYNFQNLAANTYAFVGRRNGVGFGNRAVFQYDNGDLTTSYNNHRLQFQPNQVNLYADYYDSSTGLDTYAEIDLVAGTGNIPKVLIYLAPATTGVEKIWTYDITGNITLPGNASAINYANGTSILAGIGGSYGNANVVANLAALGSNPVSTTGNVTAGTGIFGAVSVSGNISGNSASNGVRIQNYKDNVYTITYAGTITPDAFNGSIQQVTLTGNVTMNVFGGTPQAGQSMVVKMIQDGTGNRLLTSNMKFAGGSKVLTTTANAVDIISVFYDGTNYWASLTKNYS